MFRERLRADRFNFGSKASSCCFTIKAYDFTLHSSVISALDSKNVPRVLSSVWIREIRGTSSVFVLDQRLQTKPIRRTRSLLQGDPAAPAIFNATLDVPAAEFLQLASVKNSGYRLDDETYVSLILFADNFWLCATSPQELSRMTVAWLAILRRHGWNVPLDETVWCTTGPDSREDWTVQVCSQQINRSPRKSGFKVLGVILGFDNCFEIELENRMARAWRAFFKYKHLLCCRCAPLMGRLRLLDNLVSSSLFWCSASWNLTQRQSSKLRGLQLDMLHKMLTLKRGSDEEQSVFMLRLNSKSKHLKILHKVQDWDKRYYFSRFWLGGSCCPHDPVQCRTTHSQGTPA